MVLISHDCKHSKTCVVYKTKNSRFTQTTTRIEEGTVYNHLHFQTSSIGEESKKVLEIVCWEIFWLEVMWVAHLKYHAIGTDIHFSQKSHLANKNSGPRKMRFFATGIKMRNFSYLSRTLVINANFLMLLIFEFLNLVLQGKCSNLQTLQREVNYASDFFYLSSRPTAIPFSKICEKLRKKSPLSRLFWILFQIFF